MASAFSGGEAQRARTYRGILAELELRVEFEFVDYIPTLKRLNVQGITYRDRLGRLCLDVKRGLGWAWEREVFAHEVAHALLGHVDALASDDPPSRTQIEAEADTYGRRLLERWRELGCFDQ